MARPALIEVRVVLDDVLGHQADVVVLKHAQALYGVDEVVWERLKANGVTVAFPPVGSFTIADATGALKAAQVVFLGVESLHAFGYGEIRDFGRRSMTVLAGIDEVIRHVALTIHGPGYGLDEVESFESELAGVIDAISENEYPEALEKVTFVELDRSRVKRLQGALARLLPQGLLERAEHGGMSHLSKSAKSALRTSGYGSASKPKVFVAMPFASEMDDVFHYGIQGAAHTAGLLAERADLTPFTGDVVQWVQARISGAELVVADLTSANPRLSGGWVRLGQRGSDGSIVQGRDRS
jgi:hypothetical protein